MNKLAVEVNLGPTGGFRGFGALGLEGKEGSAAVSVFSGVISTAIGIISVVAIIWFIVQLLTAAVGIISSGGDKGKFESAKNKITTSIIGLVVVIAGVFIVDLLGSLVGLN
ncbi:MAG: hypothetical protein AAB656_04065, partial [Patescibacteria group bacterium]